MRRGRSIREHRNQLIRTRVLSTAEKRKRIKAIEAALPKAQRKKLSRQKIEEIRAFNKRSRAEKKLRVKKDKTRRVFNPREHPSFQPINIPSFQPYDEFQPKSQFNVLHVIESLGLGGAQVMMMEMINGLKKYYSDSVNNFVIHLAHHKQNVNAKFYKSYNVFPEHVNFAELNDYCVVNNIHVLVHHRLAISRCLKKFLPVGVKYILVNHTWNNLQKMRDFKKCDLYVSVCGFLNKKTDWPDFIHETRKPVILNGIENDFIASLSAEPLKGKYKTGRCHRLVPSKFSIDSIDWMEQSVLPIIPGFRHYIMGSHKSAEAASSGTNSVRYLGPVLDKNKKFSVLKSFDTYFYETSQNEGASIAILESLACGVPVICKRLGGNDELIVDGRNGFLVSDRNGFLSRMKQLSSDKDMLSGFKSRAAEDFDNRLHIRHTACKYMQLFECLK